MAKACVIGWPVEHSRSPLIYRYWLEHYGIDGAYEKEAVRPEDFPAFVEALAENGYVGANVTLPHKEAALRLARTADEAAIAIGAANTLWLDGDGRLHASNTDAYGFMTNLDAEAPQWNEGLGAAMVLGAGGAARAILYGLIRATDAKIFLANRTWKRAESLARRFGARVGVVDWDRRGEVLAACGLLINTTSLGMTGQAALCLRTPSSRTSSTTRFSRRFSWRRRSEATPRSTASACCSIRRCRASSAGSACGPT
jgi:shikimate dehydrogenase